MTSEKPKILGVEWAAGFFEGEGYVGFTHQIHKKYERDYPKFVVSIAQVCRKPLDEFEKIFGLGTVRGPYGPYSTTRQAHYQYLVSGEKAKVIILQLLPYLFKKGDQALAALYKYEEHKDAKRA